MQLLFWAWIGSFVAHLTSTSEYSDISRATTERYFRSLTLSRNVSRAISSAAVYSLALSGSRSLACWRENLSYPQNCRRESGSLARATSLRSLQHGIQVLVDHLVGPRLALKYVPTREPCRVAAAFRERQQHVGIRSHGCFVGQRLRRAHGVVEGVERQQRRADGGQLVDRGRALIVVLDRIELRAQGKVRELVS